MVKFVYAIMLSKNVSEGPYNIVSPTNKPTKAPCVMNVT